MESTSLSMGLTLEKLLMPVFSRGWSSQTAQVVECAYYRSDCRKCSLKNYQISKKSGCNVHLAVSHIYSNYRVKPPTKEEFMDTLARSYRLYGSYGFSSGGACREQVEVYDYLGRRVRVWRHSWWHL